MSADVVRNGSQNAPVIEPENTIIRLHRVIEMAEAAGDTGLRSHLK